MIARAYTKYASFLEASADRIARGLSALAGEKIPTSHPKVQSGLRLLALGVAWAPELVVEVGVSRGGSCISWSLLAKKRKKTRVKAIDVSLDNWRDSYPKLKSAFIPVEKIQATQQDARSVDWKTMLRGYEDESVLLFIDAHDSPRSQLMSSIIHNAFPLLMKRRSLVVVHDFMFHGVDRRGKNHEYLPPRVEKSGRTKWGKGVIYGFREVPVLLKWVRKQKIDFMLVEEELGDTGKRLASQGYKGDWLPTEETWSSIGYFQLGRP